MTLPESIAIGSFVLSTVGFMWKMSKDITEIKKQVTNDIQHISEETDKKRSRVYERLDEYKKASDEKFTTKDICNILHTQLNKDVTEIKTDVKILLKRENK